MKVSLSLKIVCKQYSDKLTAEGEEIKGSWIMSRILNMLPPKLSFPNFFDCINSGNKNLNKLFELLRLEEDRLNESKGVSLSYQNVLVSKIGKHNKTQSQKIECHTCGKVGHIKKNCKGKSCVKYLEYYKKNYECNICKKGVILRKIVEVIKKRMKSLTKVIIRAIDERL